MTQSLINEMYTLYFLFSREKSKHADHTLKFDGTTNRNKPQAPDDIYFTHNRNKYPIPNNTQSTHRRHLGYISNGEISLKFCLKLIV